VAVLVVLAILLLTGCKTTKALPPSAPPAVEVLVPVVQPCAVAKVEVTPVATSVPHDIYGAVQRILADRQNLLADREALVAANTDPCPEVKK
jgi:hypothetical protein